MGNLDPAPASTASQSDVHERNQRAKVVVAFALVYVFWGSTYLAIRITSAEGIPPLVMCALRFLIAGPIMLLACAYFGRRVRIARREALRLAVIGVLLLVGGNGTLAWAEQYVPSGFAALLLAVTPIWFLVLETFVFRGDRMSRRGIIGLILGVFGIAILVWPRITHREAMGTTQLMGSVSLLFSSFSWAVGSVLSRQWQMKVDPLVATGWEMCFASFAHCVLALTTGQYHRAVFTRRGVIAVLYLVVFGSWVGYTAYVWLLKHVPTPKVATYAYVNPIVAVILGMIFLRESFDHFMLAGTVVITAAVVLVTTAQVHLADRKEHPGEGIPELESEV
ncbi:MAG TPA: EamA family transporter [Candidatus Angelobacter sp.]|jgi:drug/metabolite transporter (DMT)-like permease|nr:EamA family transporter [Candidatus Angelobacter sp.]